MTRSPWSTDGHTRSGKTGVSPLGSSARADSGHLQRHIGKSTISPRLMAGRGDDLNDGTGNRIISPPEPRNALLDRRR
jgi:hypothetical protein